MKKYFKSLILGIVLLAVIIFGIIKVTNKNNEVHYHAGYLVYINGVMQNYSDSKYMQAELCIINDHSGSKGQEQIEKAHLHNNIGDVVHVHRAGAKWEDLFKNINVKFSERKDIVGYINGRKINDILNYPIKPYDSVIFVVGETGSEDINNYVSQEYIREVEKNSVEC